ncbi:hypothetical protein ABID22_000120 [Pontibacter aydingkolensis]|uniref:PepSY-associated TM region n=1 Tax=Pontibacter aydingkolensis TaxID=1911536 RepID=A0ABS7CRR2_9BACT|nr:hypothetical protein [Pontibacter aydingkolensis]MBW7466212.1 hypothetical protein [Pontibacter aydingkolensis]
MTKSAIGLFFNGVNPGVKRLIVGVFFIIAIPLLIMTSYYTIKFENYDTQFMSYYFPNDPVSKGEYDHLWSLHAKRQFYTYALSFFSIGYITIMLFSLWVWQGFKKEKNRTGKDYHI